MKRSQAFRMIETFYGGNKAERSGVPLINHIREGIAVLSHLNADIPTQCAWCLHPMFQSDYDLKEEGLHFATMLDGDVLLLVMEYRNQANAWLSGQVYDNGFKIVYDGFPSPGPLEGVKQMLIADKVQNYKDFITFHENTHRRSRELKVYFTAWLKALEVTDTQFKQLCEVIDGEKEKAKGTEGS